MDSISFILLAVGVLAAVIGVMVTLFKRPNIPTTKYTQRANKSNQTEEKPISLSSIAEKILIAGSEGPIPEITVKEIIGGALYINTYGNKFGTLDPQEKIENKKAIEELINNELIKYKRKDVYSLTASGLVFCKNHLMYSNFT